MAAERGMVVSHSFVDVLKLVLAQVAVDETVITAFGTDKVAVPKVIDWFVAFTVKVVVGTVPCSLKWLLNQTISLALLLCSETL